MTEPGVIPIDAAERRRRIRRTAVLLGIVAIAFYVGFIVMSVMRGLK